MRWRSAANRASSVPAIARRKPWRVYELRVTIVCSAVPPPASIYSAIDTSSPDSTAQLHKHQHVSADSHDAAEGELLPFAGSRPYATLTTVVAQAFRHTTRPWLHASIPFGTRLTPMQARLLSAETRSAIDKAVGSAPVVLFMKGTPETPQCGFSRASIQILGLQGVDPGKFSAFNVLEDEDLRQGERSRGLSGRPTLMHDRPGIKEYSEWPTIPQLFVNKKFVGGCDILMTMHQDGELAKMLEDEKVLVPAEADKDT